MGLKDHPCQMF